MKEESLKVQLKAADEKELVELVNGVTEQIRNGRYRKVEVQRDVVTVLSQRRPPCQLCHPSGLSGVYL